MQFDDSITDPSPGLNTRELVFDRPLELYRDSLAPVFDELDFVVKYILSFRDPQQSVYQIDPFEMRLYVRGEITTKRLTEMMLITSL